MYTYSMSAAWSVDLSSSITRVLVDLAHLVDCALSTQNISSGDASEPIISSARLPSAGWTARRRH
jgi:hypothetical protein